LFPNYQGSVCAAARNDVSQGNQEQQADERSFRVADGPLPVALKTEGDVATAGRGAQSAFALRCDTGTSALAADVQPAALRLTLLWEMLASFLSAAFSSVKVCSRHRCDPAVSPEAMSEP
jgi:hypothetical protein